MIKTQAFANTIQLYSDSHTRRLFKARHHEMDNMEIRAQTLTESTIPTMSGLPALPTRSCTVYMFQIRGAACTKPSSANGSDLNVTDSDDGEWLLTRRYSEFAAFRTTMLRLVRQWESHLGECPHKLHSREFELVSNSLRRPITPSFPRKHLRSDNALIVRERRHGLRDFVRKLLDAYADLSVYFFNSQQHQTSNESYLRGIYDQLETFLQVPRSQKELERRHTAAVLALEDVQMASLEESSHGSSGDHPDRTCCICLDDYDCAVHEKSNASDDFGEDQIEALARDKMVKLPCGHHFHEDCVIEWFNTSITCPLCRQPAVREDKPMAFDVSAV